MNAYVLVERDTDAELLRRLLPPNTLPGVEPVVTGRGSIVSLARSLLATRRKPVVLVRDAETVSPELIRERRANTEDMLRLVAGDVPCRVIQAVPALDAIFFRAPAVLERFFGRNIPTEWVALGQRDPTGVLQLLSDQASHPWNRIAAVSGLEEEEASALRSAPVIEELDTFLRGIERGQRSAVAVPGT